MTPIEPTAAQVEKRRVINAAMYGSGEKIRHKQIPCSKFMCLPEQNPHHYEIVDTFPGGADAEKTKTEPLCKRCKGYGVCDDMEYCPDCNGTGAPPPKDRGSEEM